MRLNPEMAAQWLRNNIGPQQRTDIRLLVIGVAVYVLSLVAYVPFLVVRFIAGRDDLFGLGAPALLPLFFIVIGLGFAPMGFLLCLITGTPLSTFSALKLYWRGVLGVIFIVSGVFLGLISISFFFLP